MKNNTSIISKSDARDIAMESCNIPTNIMESVNKAIVKGYEEGAGKVCFGTTNIKTGARLKLMDMLKKEGYGVVFESDQGGGDFIIITL